MAAENESQIVKRTMARYAYCRDNGHITFVTKANLCDDYFSGIQWDPIIKKRLERQGKPVLTINKTLATLAAVMGEQLKNRADISFKPLKGGTQPTAGTLNKVFIQIANNNKLDWVEANVADDGFISSRGFYDCRPSFDDHMQGEVKIKSLNPRNVVIDPDAEEYDPATWKDVTITKWLTLDDIEMLYGVENAKKVRSRGSSVPFEYDSIERSHQTFGGFVIPPSDSSYDNETNADRKFRIVERQYKRKRMAWHFVDEATGDTRLVPDSWTTAKVKKVAKKANIKTMKKKVEQIRWTVVCLSTVLFDEWSPLKYFTVVPYFPFFRHGKTIGIVENLISSQDLLNKTSSQELHIVNTTANSGWKVKAGSLQNMSPEELEERGAETGLVMELADVNDVEKITPNTVPSGLDRISFKADEFIKQISGVSDSARGFDRADVAAKAIQAKQAAGSVNLAKPFDNLARSRHMLAERTLNIVQTYYTEERILQITGNNIGAQTEDLTINERTPEGTITNDLTLGEYEVVVTTAPARNNFQETQFEEAVRLRELGVQVPDALLIQNSSLDNKEEIVQQQAGTPEQQQIEQEMAQMEMQEKRIEIAEKESKAMLNRANAQLAMKRAAKVQSETEIDNVTAMKDINAPVEGGQDQGQQAQLAFQQSEADQTRAFEREKFEDEKRRKDDEEARKYREGVQKQILEEKKLNQQQNKQAQTA